MACFNRIVVVALILCLSRTPLPWGHSHDGMDAKQLAVHVQKCHPAASERDLPQGWHWHVTPIDVVKEHDRSTVIEARSENSLTMPTPDVATGICGTKTISPGTSCGRCLSTAQAVRQQQTHLHLNVLLI